MAIAALGDWDVWDEIRVPAAPPRLRLLGAQEGPAAVPDLRRCVDDRPAAVPTEIDAPPLRLGQDVTVRRSARRSARLRRRRMSLGVLTAALLTAVALPVGLVGGRPADGAANLPGAADGGPGITYVVQPGDTLRSIAQRVDPADPGPLTRVLVRQTGSPVVVPGEHLLLP